MPDIRLQFLLSGSDQYGNSTTDFQRVWDINGTLQYNLDTNGAITGQPFNVDTHSFTLLPSGDIQIKSPGTAIIRVREILPSGKLSDAAYSFVLDFSWR
jgi:hypothetical protein